MFKGTILVFIALFIFSGCSVSYKRSVRNMGLQKIGKDLPYDANAYEYEKRRELANLNRFHAEKVYGDSIMGYVGYVWNEKPFGVTYRIYDPDGVRVAQGYLSPAGEEGSEHKKYLMPVNPNRKYTVEVEIKKKTYFKTFPVSSVVDDIGTKKGHWHIVIRR